MKLLGTPMRWSSAYTVLPPVATPCELMPVGGSRQAEVMARIRVPSSVVIRRRTFLSTSPAHQSSL